MAAFNGDNIEVDAVLENAPDKQSSIQGATAVQSMGTSTRGHEKQSTEMLADDDDTYKEYLDIIKSVIPDDIDILIISDDDDIDEVREFKKDLEKNISYYLYNNLMEANVEILDDIPGFPPTIMDEAYKRALFIFLFVTENFCRKKFKVLQWHACLKESLNDESKRRIVVPVHTGPKNCRLYELTLTLNATQSLCYSDGAFIEQVNKLFEQEKNTIANRRLDLEDTRKIYFAENHLLLERQKAFLDSHSRSVKSSEGNKSRATTDKVKSLGKMEDITMSQGQRTGSLQLVQSNASLVPQSSSHPIGNNFEQRQQFTTDASHSSQKSLQNSPSIQRCAMMTHNAQSHGEDQTAEMPHSFYSKDDKDLQLMGVKMRMERDSTKKIPQKDHFLAHDVVCDLDMDTPSAVIRKLWLSVIDKCTSLCTGCVEYQGLICTNDHFKELTQEYLTNTVCTTLTLKELIVVALEKITREILLFDQQPQPNISITPANTTERRVMCLWKVWRQMKQAPDMYCSGCLAEPPLNQKVCPNHFHSRL